MPIPHQCPDGSWQCLARCPNCQAEFLFALPTMTVTNTLTFSQAVWVHEAMVACPSCQQPVQMKIAGLQGPPVVEFHAVKVQRIIPATVVI